MEEADYPGIRNSGLGLLLVVVCAYFQVEGRQQCVSYRRYVRLLEARRDYSGEKGVSVALWVSLGVEVCACVCAPLLLYPAAGSAHLLFLSHYRRRAEHRTGTCREALASVLCASSLRQQSLSLACMALGVRERAETSPVLDFGYIGALLIAVVPVRYCPASKPFSKLIFAGLLHGYFLCLLKRLISAYVQLSQVSLPTLSLFSLALVLEITVDGHVLDPQTDELVGFCGYFIVLCLALVPTQAALHSETSPNHSLLLAGVAIALSLTVKCRQGTAVMLKERGNMLKIRYFPAENQAESTVNTSFQFEEKKA